MRLYHGSKSGIVGDIAPVSRDCCDFGRGFYLGSEPTQPLTLICSKERPSFYVCEADFSGLAVHVLKPDIDWALFVAWNCGLIPDEFRAHYDARYRPIAESSDVIVGKIANDRMVVVLDWFFKSLISDVGLIEALKVLNLGDQYVCKTRRACERVKIVERRILASDECERLTSQSRNRRDYAIKAVDRIRLFHRRDGESFYEIMQRETGRGPA